MILLSYYLEVIMARKNSKNIEVTENLKEIETTSKPVTEKYKTEKCKVLSYNEKTKELDLDFKGYGIRINNVDEIKSDFVSVKYRGEIGKPNFSCRL